MPRTPNVGVVILVVLAVGFLTRPIWEPRLFGSRSHGGKPERVYTAEDYKKAATHCMELADLECAEKDWKTYLTLRPSDATAYAKLGIVLNQRDDNKNAVAAFERAIALGEGTYDLFAYYADSLANLDRNEDAANWYYKALAVAPTLVDVRGKLAKLLVLQKRHYEALSLLESFDAQLQAQGYPPYFEGQRISIETTLTNRGAAGHSNEPAFRLPKYQDHYYAPVSIGDARPEAFVVDTGASSTTVDEGLLLRSKASHKPAQSEVLLQTADGRTISAKAVVVDSMRIGPYLLKNVPVVICKRCVSLLGQSTLSRFDLRSSKVNGVEFLTLSLR